MPEPEQPATAGPGDRSDFDDGMFAHLFLSGEALCARNGAAIIAQRASVHVCG